MTTNDLFIPTASDSLPKTVECIICCKIKAIGNIKFCNNSKCGIGICLDCVEFNDKGKCPVCTLDYKVRTLRCIGCSGQDDLHITTDGYTKRQKDYICGSCGVDCFYCGKGYSNRDSDFYDSDEVMFLTEIMDLPIELCANHTHLLWEFVIRLTKVKYLRIYAECHNRKLKYFTKVKKYYDPTITIESSCSDDE